MSECCHNLGKKWAGEKSDVSKYIWEVELTGVELGEGDSKKTASFLLELPVKDISLKGKTKE